MIDAMLKKDSSTHLVGDLQGPQQQHAVNSLMLMCTSHCQLNCDYCEIRRVPASMSFPVLRKAVELLLSTQKPECQLRFWGGEPLLRWDLIKSAIRYARQQAIKRSKKITFMITTNGLLLDKEKISFLKEYPVEVMFSLDGDRRSTLRHRVALNKKDYYASLLAQLGYLKRSGIPFFINMVVTPDTINELLKNICFLKDRAEAPLQLGYQTGIRWTAKEKKLLVDELVKIRALPGISSILMNFTNHCEPTMLSQEIIVDTDGSLYFDAAIFLEKAFPRLRKEYFLGNVFRIHQIDPLFKTKYDLYKIFTRACSAGQKHILDNNIELGITLDNLFNTGSPESINSNEHPMLIPLIKGDFKSQKEHADRLKIGSLFLYIDGPCANDCIFCVQKKGTAQADLFTAWLKLQENRALGMKKLCIIGNDPLLYPQIFEVVELAKKYGFEAIEIMTSGESLADTAFTRRLVQAGVNSFSLPLFSHTGRVHDTIVGTRGSHTKVLRGIENASRNNALVFIHTNVLKQNLRHLLPLEGFVKQKLGKPFVALPVRPKTANLPIQKLMPSYRDMAGLLQGVDCLVGFPLCIVKKIQKDLLKCADEIADSMKIYLLDQRFIKFKACTGCLFADKCLGVIGGYRTLYGTEGIRRIKK
jgi:sulfatase maturation enzyme AslB (radical SAM superfamily)